jgi:hypothetical protein
MTPLTPMPSIEYLNECFEANLKEGTLFWKARPLHHFNSIHIMRNWNSRFAGKQTGSIRKTGYMTVMINNKNYAFHRIIYFMSCGEQPPHIDHIDNDPLNNKASNLRGATASQNACNKRKPKHNTSGVKGLTWSKKHNRWHASVFFEGRRKYVGMFKEISEATAALQKRREELHKDFANHE